MSSGATTETAVAPARSTAPEYHCPTNRPNGSLNSTKNSAEPRFPTRYTPDPSVVDDATNTPDASCTETVTPDTGLTDFTPVQVTGTGFDGRSLLEGYQCRGGAVNEFDCDSCP